MAIRLEAEILEGRFGKKPEAPAIEQVVVAYLGYLRTENKAKKTIQSGVSEAADTGVEPPKARPCGYHDLSFIDAYRAETVARKIKPASPKTVLNETVVIRQFVNFAISRNMIDTDPLHGTKETKKSKVNRSRFGRGEVDPAFSPPAAPHQWARLSWPEPASKSTKFAVGSRGRMSIWIRVICTFARRKAGRQKRAISG